MNSVAHCGELPINVARPLRHIYELGAWLVTQGPQNPRRKDCPPRTRMLATTVDFLKESGQVLFIITGPLTDAIRGVNQLTRTSCSRCPCESTTFQENLTVSAASTSGGAVLFCWVMKNIPIIQAEHFRIHVQKLKTKDLVCTKKQEIHANNSKVKIKYV